MKSAKGSGSRRLERDRIVRAALRIASHGSFKEISMTGVARELGVTPMALYRHVGNKDDLLRLVVEAVNEQIALPPPESGAWMDQFRLVLRAINDRYAEYPGLAAFVLASGTVSPGPAGTRIAEWFLRHYLSAGLSAERAALAYGTFREFFLVGLIQPPRDFKPIPESPGRSPELNAVIKHMNSISANDRFEFAFRVFSEWLEAQAFSAQESTHRASR